MVLVTEASMAYISPFLRSLPEPRSKEVIASIEELKLWMETQPHLPSISGTEKFMNSFINSYAINKGFKFATSTHEVRFVWNPKTIKKIK